jgi:mRNA interferase RelE/StbE
VKIDQLALDPRPAGTARLQGHADLLRVRVGRYRVVYLVDSREKVLVIVRIGHRREVYRGLR